LAASASGTQAITRHVFVVEDMPAIAGVLVHDHDVRAEVGELRRRHTACAYASRPEDL
jgi:hypothetical protein